MASIPPITDELQSELGLSATAAGILTAAPVLCFGAFAFVAPVLARRTGAERLLWLALIPIVVGVAGRAAGSSAALFAGTVLAGIGIAIGNVILPSIVKNRFERATGLVTGTYVAALTAGAALAAGLTVPLERSIGTEPPSEPQPISTTCAGAAAGSSTTRAPSGTPPSSSAARPSATPRTAS